MTAETTRRFQIRFDSWCAPLFGALWLPPRESYVELNADFVIVRMAWAFAARFPRASVQSITPLGRKPISRGVHGFAGRWLVNGSGAGIVTLRLEPEQRCRVLGMPVALRELMLSLDEPDAFTAALRSPHDVGS